MTSSIDKNIQRVSLVAFLVLMVAVLLGTMTSRGFVPFAPASFQLYAGLVVYLILAYKFEEPGKFGAAGSAVYFATHVLLFAWIFRLGIPANYLFLLAMPVVSQAGACLRWPGTFMVCAAYLAVMCFVFQGMKPNWAGTWATLSSIVPAFTFVVAFSILVKNALVSRTCAESLAAELEQANAQLRASAEQTAALSAANERNRIARDIHDGVGHYLTVVTVQLQAARVLLRDQPDKAEEALSKAESMSRAALEEVRRSVGALRSASASPPLPQALQGLVIESGSLAILEIRGEPRRLPEAMEQAIFRVAQEGLTNARKHARAKLVKVLLNFETPSATRIVILDDGQGCVGQPSGGFGLLGLRERVDAFGGKFSAASRADGGFALEVEVPA